jgi:hypothetical protein
MKIHTLPARSGLSWITDGLRLTRQYWFVFAVILLCYVFLTVSPTMLIPKVGGFWVFLAAPILSFGVLSAFRSASDKQKPNTSQLSAGFKLPSPLTKRLVLLGVVNLLGSLTILASTTLIDGGTIMQLVTGSLLPNDPALRMPNAKVSVLLFVALLVPFQALLWYAPPFIGWHKLPVAQALFYSGVAVWRNKLAFLVFGLCWLMLGYTALIALSLFQAVISVLLGKELAAQLQPLVNVPVSVMLLVTLNAAVWCSYKQIMVEPIPTSLDSEPTI